MACAVPRIGRYGRGPGDRIEPRSKRPPARRRSATGPGTAATVAENWRRECRGDQSNLLNCWNLIKYYLAGRPGADGPRPAAHSRSARAAPETGGDRRRAAVERAAAPRLGLRAPPASWQNAELRCDSGASDVGRGRVLGPNPAAELGGQWMAATGRRPPNESEPRSTRRTQAFGRGPAPANARRRKKGAGRAGPESGGNPGRKLRRSYRLARQCLLTL